MANRYILQNNRLVWVDANANVINNDDTQHTFKKLQKITDQIDTFTRTKDCLRFLDRVKYEQVSVITSGSLGQHLVKHIHHMSQVDAIYIFCDNPDRHQSWASEWSKIKGVYNHIKPICKALQSAVKRTNEDFSPISFFSRNSDDREISTDDLNRLDPSFMYTTLFKRILLDMKHEPNERKAIIKLWRTKFADNPENLKIIEDFDQNYQPDRAIWWYTRECFIYQMLNQALRLLESDIIVDMGFFIHDLHRRLKQLHRKQSVAYHDKPLTLYRGQGLTVDDFTTLRKNQGGLLAFNSFLSMSTTKSVPLQFARKFSSSDKMVGILFMMNVDPTIRSAIFARIEEHSYFQKENEILFSMHTIFRIDDVLRLDRQDRSFEVRLTLTSEDDPELSQLTNRIEEDVGSGSGWHRLGQMLLNVGQINKAEELYLTLLEQEPSKQNQWQYYHCLGLINSQQGDYQGAIEYYEQAISIKEKVFSPTDPDLATSYNNIGLVYKDMGEHSSALSYFNRSVGIYQKTLPLNHPSLATAYNNIGLVYKNMGEYSQALSYFNKSHCIYQKTLPLNHPLLAISYNNIGLVYKNMGEYSQALSYFNKSLAIDEKSLPSEHPSLATSYNNIGLVYNSMGEYPQALSYFEKSLAIRQKSLPPEHPSLATSYNNMGLVYNSMGEYSQALSYFEKSLAIRHKSLPRDHPSLVTSYNNIGGTFYALEAYSEAKSYLEKALRMRQHSLPSGYSGTKDTLDMLADVNEKL